MKVKQRQAIFYKDLTTGVEPARKWLESLKDNRGRAIVATRIGRAEMGNFGDHRALGEGVLELKIDFGPGYRLYFALEGDEIILLLVGGDKSSQSKDIRRAKEYWQRHKEETNG